MDWGYYTPDPAADKSFRQYFNPGNNSFQLNTTLPARLQQNDFFYNYNYLQNAEECKEKEDNSCGENIVSFGLSIRLEDFGSEKKVFPGLTGSYTRMFGDVVGGTFDATVNFGKVNDTKYTIGSFYLGPTFYPFHNTLGVHDKISLSAHTLAGYNKVCQRYMDNKNSYGNFSLKLGASLDVNLNCKAGLRFSASDYMVLGDGNTSNNIVLSAGARFSF